MTEEGYFVKDLRIFTASPFDDALLEPPHFVRDLRDIVIIDNSAFSFAFQIDNGVPIIPFYDDKADEELLHLIYYLNCLAKADDVRVQNRQAFELYRL